MLDNIQRMNDHLLGPRRPFLSQLSEISSAHLSSRDPEHFANRGGNSGALFLWSFDQLSYDR